MTEQAATLHGEALYGVAVDVAPQIRRVLAPNPGPFTYTGTATHIVGQGRVAIIDPGPDNASHVAALLRAVRGETVTHIVLTHTHHDHTGALDALREATGATVAGCAAYRPSRSSRAGENPLDARNDTTYQPDMEMADGDAIDGPGWTLSAIATPGHSANHIAFALRGSSILFPGDHVMSWSTTIVAPPDGSMRDYMSSLDRLLLREERLYLPAHGEALREPHAYMRAVRTHRLAREAAIINRLLKGDRTIPQIVEAIYTGIDPRLTRAAALSVLAHLEDLCDRGLAASEGEPTLTGCYFPPDVRKTT